MRRELEDVEKPFVAQLQALGWIELEGSLDDPAVTGRTRFSEVIQEGVLRERLRALNPGPPHVNGGEPWLDEARLSEAVAAITRLGTHRLMEANQKATELLIKGLTVEGLPGWDGGRGQTIRFIDWDNPANNRFTVVRQYRVDCPPGFDAAKAFIVVDLVLLVNGIPLVVVECKSPSIPEPLAAAVDQLRRYSNQRKAALEIDDNEGNEALFATNQLLVATSFDEARVGCIGAAFEHFAPWKTVVGPDGTTGRAGDLYADRAIASTSPRHDAGGTHARMCSYPAGRVRLQRHPGMTPGAPTPSLLTRWMVSRLQRHPGMTPGAPRLRRSALAGAPRFNVTPA